MGAVDDRPAGNVFALLGTMLGASLPWAQGTVSVERDGDTYLERFYQVRGRTWRIERDGLVFTDRPGYGSRVRYPDGREEHGPSGPIRQHAAVQLLRPVNALIWGRPGEDWRLTGNSDLVAPGRWRVTLEHVEDSSIPGHLVVDERTGVLHELALGAGHSLTLLELEAVNVEDLTEEALLA